jgi:hypothetical protein
VNGRRFSQVALDNVRARNPVNEVAGRWVLLRRHGRGFIGPCPIHSPDPQARDSTSFECTDAETWVCATCQDGGDVFRLVEQVLNLDFVAAVEWLGGAREADPEQERRIDEERARRRAERERQAALYRDQERCRTFEIWRRGLPVKGTPVAAYLALRGLEAPPRSWLRAALDMPLYASGGKDAAILHRGPCMLAAIVGPAGRFAGVHFTWIDLDQPNGKAAVTDPEMGHRVSAKKMRGSVKGGHIELVPEPLPSHLVLGEGIETVLSVWVALMSAGRDLDGWAFWSGLDLGNIGGLALEKVAAPGRDVRGRIRYVPGPEPDLSEPGIAIPDSVDELVLLGDSDSDPFLTRCAIARAGKRYARLGRQVRVAWAPNGADFNDVLRGAK